MTPISIDGLNIGVDYQPYVIAELSGNHKGDLNRALDLMVAAKEAGAHAVKLQTYTPDTMTIDCDAPIFRIHGGLWDGRSLYELYGEAQTPWQRAQRQIRKNGASQLCCAMAAHMPSHATNPTTNARQSVGRGPHRYMTSPITGTRMPDVFSAVATRSSLCCERSKRSRRALE